MGPGRGPLEQQLLIPRATAAQLRPPASAPSEHTDTAAVAGADQRSVAAGRPTQAPAERPAPRPACAAARTEISTMRSGRRWPDGRRAAAGSRGLAGQTPTGRRMPGMGRSRSAERVGGNLECPAHPRGCELGVLAKLLRDLGGAPVAAELADRRRDGPPDLPGVRYLRYLQRRGEHCIGSAPPASPKWDSPPPPPPPLPPPPPP